MEADVDISNDLSIGNHLQVVGDVSMEADVDISNNLVVRNSSSISNDLSIGNHLQVVGDVSMESNLEISNNLTVREDASFNANVSVVGYLTVENQATFLESTTIEKNLALNSDLIVDGTTTFNGHVNSSSFTGDISGDLTGTILTAIQPNITSVGILTSLQVDNISLDGNIISSTTGALTINDGSTNAFTIDIDSGVVTGATSITSTTFIGDVSGHLTGDILAGDGTSVIIRNGTDGTDATFTGELQTPIQPNITGTGALNSGSIISGFGDINNGSSNITTTGAINCGNLAISGDALTVDSSGNVDASGNIYFKNGSSLQTNPYGGTSEEQKTNLIGMSADSDNIVNISENTTNPTMVKIHTPVDSGNSVMIINESLSTTPIAKFVNTGEVGIGTNDPTEKLEVNGNIKSNGLIIGSNSLINSSNRIDASKIAGGSVSDTEFNYLNGASGSIQTQINTRYVLGEQLRVGSGTWLNNSAPFRVRTYHEGFGNTGHELRLSSDDHYRGLFLHGESSTGYGFFGLGFGGSTYDKNIHIYSRNSDDTRQIIGFFENTNASQTTVNFTGQHPCIVNSDITEYSIGLIVSTTGNYLNEDNQLTPTINESLPICTITAIENDKKVFGVISNEEDENSSRNYGVGIFKTINKRANNNERRIFINSVGEGSIWVCNINGPIYNGDYISSSSIPGYGMKQTKNEDCLTNYTVAKITCDCDFNLNKIIKQKLKTETIIDASDNENSMIIFDNSGNIQYEDDLDTNGLPQYIYKYNTRFIDEYGNIIQYETDYITRLNNGENVFISCFVGCTYHCG